MIAYSYDPITGLPGPRVQCDPSPLEEGVFLLPAFATFDEPPVPPPDKVVVRKGEAWVAEKVPEPEPTPEPVLTPEDRVRQLTATVQAHLDAVAQSWGYDNVYTAATYAEEPAVKAFQDEGKALRAWRSRVWAAARQTLADVQAGKTPLPTVAELIASLPAAPSRG